MTKRAKATIKSPVTASETAASKTLTPAASPKLASASSGESVTDDQMQQLAQSFHDISVAIGQIRLDAIKAGASLTDSNIVQLQGYVFSLKNISDNLALQSANLTLENADQALKQISLATGTANRALVKIARIDKAVQIASALIVLGAAITTQDFPQIASAATLVMDTCGVSLDKIIS
jgi:hypothetical protein